MMEEKTQNKIAKSNSQVVHNFSTELSTLKTLILNILSRGSRRFRRSNQRDLRDLRLPKRFAYAGEINS